MRRRRRTEWSLVVLRIGLTAYVTVLSNLFFLYLNSISNFFCFFSRASDPTAKMSHLFQINEFTMNMPMHLKIYGTKLHRQSIWARSLHTNRRQTMAQRHSIYQRRDVLLYSRRMALRLVWFVKINSTLNIFHLQNQFTINCTVD